MRVALFVDERLASLAGRRGSGRQIVELPESFLSAEQKAELSLHKAAPGSDVDYELDDHDELTRTYLIAAPTPEAVIEALEAWSTHRAARAFYQARIADARLLAEFRSLHSSRYPVL